jgi:hypothetical protein
VLAADAALLVVLPPDAAYSKDQPQVKTTQSKERESDGRLVVN